MNFCIQYPEKLHPIPRVRLHPIPRVFPQEKRAERQVSLSGYRMHWYRGGMGEAVQLEIFGVSAVEPPWRDNRDAMEYPFLALQKKRTRPIEYSAKGIH